LPVFDNPEGFENWLLFSSDVAFTFRCKRWATALHFNLFARSTIQIPANSQTQNLGSMFPSAVTFSLHEAKWNRCYPAISQTQLLLVQNSTYSRSTSYDNGKRLCQHISTSGKPDVQMLQEIANSRENQARNCRTWVCELAPLGGQSLTQFIQPVTCLPHQSFSDRA